MNRDGIVERYVCMYILLCNRRRGERKNWRCFDESRNRNSTKAPRQFNLGESGINITAVDRVLRRGIEKAGKPGHLHVILPWPVTRYSA